MKRVFKYQIEITDYVHVKMPAGSQILTIDEQGGRVSIWALVDPDEKSTIRKFRVFGTGHPIDNADKLIFIQSIQLGGGQFVFHIFEEK